MQDGNEPNQPNSLDVCKDGNSGSYPSSQSIEQIIVRSGDVNGVGSGVDMVEGNNATIIATVLANEDPRFIYADFYYTSKIESIPDWKLIGTRQPPGRGQHVLQINYILPSGETDQAVRVSFRNGGTTSLCSFGNYDDVDDLVFKVQQLTSPAF